MGILFEYTQSHALLFKGVLWLEVLSTMEVMEGIFMIGAGVLIEESA